MRKFTHDQQIKALSWRQPYADLMLDGKIETRTWPTNYRGWVLICSSKKAYNLDVIDDISGNEGLVRIVDIIASTGRLTQKTGYALSIGYLVDCREMLPEDEEKCFVKYRPGLFCHVYEDVQALKNPIPWKGMLGWKNVPNEFKVGIEKNISYDS